MTQKIHKQTGNIRIPEYIIKNHRDPLLNSTLAIAQL